jgi:hypothetical protein
LKTITFSILSVLLLSVGVETVIFFNVNPTASGAIVFLGFFVFFWLLIWSLSCIIGISIFKRKLDITTVRRSIILASAVMGSLLLSAFNVLNTLSLISFLIAMILTEIFFANKHSERHPA